MQSTYDFVLAKVGRQWTDNKFLNRQSPDARTVGNHDVGTKCDQERNPIGSRIGMGDGSADGSPRSHGAMGDAMSNTCQHSVRRIGNAGRPR